jgi:hypothetical protein
VQPDVSILTLRLAFTAVLYLFLILVGLIAYRDVRRATAPSGKPREQQMVAANLVVLESGDTALIPGQTFELQPVTTMGRSPTSTIVVPDGYASGEHAMLTWRDQKWWLQDLGSTNGTLLNRHLVQKSVQVNSGDVIQVGRVKLKFTRQSAK